MHILKLEDQERKSLKSFLISAKKVIDKNIWLPEYKEKEQEMRAELKIINSVLKKLF